MARRRNDSLFVVLADLPWWVSVLVAGVAYVAMKHWLPVLWASNLFLSGIATGLEHNAGALASLFLIPVFVSFLKSTRRRKLLDRQSGLESIREMSWREFEILCGEFFRRKAYSVQETGLGGADGGVDLVLRKGGETCLVQCKRWKTFKVGVREVRELYGILTAEQADRGIFITSGSYTGEAMEFAEGKPLELIDGPALLDLVRNVQKAPAPPLPANRPHPDPHAQAAVSAPACPRCGGAMIVRTAMRGANAGNQFWGCSKFPKCRGLAEMG